MSKWLNAKTGPDTALQTTRWRTGRLVVPRQRRKHPRNQRLVVVGEELVEKEQPQHQQPRSLQVGFKGSNQATPLRLARKVMGITETLQRPSNRQSDNALELLGKATTFAHHNVRG
jgi:hypothetical protein